MVAELHEQGKTPREIAAALKISTQRVYQQLSKLGVKANRAAS
jgi:DNA-binding CsgD family transcriptional regulator